MGINANEELAEKLVKILKDAVDNCMEKNEKISAKI
jgi:hypothetical protein